MAVNFTKNQNDITRAWSEVVDSTDVQNWALFSYEGNTNIIKLMSSGSNGLKGLVREFNCSLIQYAFCRVIDKQLGVNKLILINWQGESSPLSRKGLCASHVGDVANYFKGCTQTITIRNDDEATEEYLMNLIVKSSATRVSLNKPTDSLEKGHKVGSTYKKTDITSEITTVDRKSFWQRQEEEEKERLEEEKRRAAEKQAQFEKERKLREETEAKRLAETIKERDRFIEATRQADRKDSSGSQPSSIVSSNAGKDNDDERVGRRSELIRLERNQETQALISKGLIKNKRAIFEKASQEQSNQQLSSNNLTRRASGTLVTQRMNSLKSLDEASSNSGVEKLTNGFAKKLDLQGNESGKTVRPVKTEMESIKITEVVPPENFNSAEEPTNIKTAPISNNAKSPVKPASPSPRENCNNDLKDENFDTNGNNNYISKNESECTAKNDDIKQINGKLSSKAKALYDYQAADNTEISFDPDDLICSIDKVDSGWWHGQVMTGRFKGQSGLFPANYVEEL